MTDEQRDNLLLSIVSKIDKNTAQLEKNTAQLERNTAQIKENTAKIQENTVELERQRKNIARLEHTLNDKIAALFDAREVNLDKFEDQEKKFESINRILDNHNARIFKLETSRN